MDIPLDEVLHFDAVTSDATGAAVDADSTPTFSVFEEATDTPIQTGNFTKRTALDGEYRGTVTLSAANGFEVGKWYHVKGYATVDTVAGKAVVLNSFRIVAAETQAGVPKVDLAYSLGVAITNSDFTIASATATTLTLPTTYTNGNSLPDDDRYTYTVLQVVGGTGAGQLVLLTTAGASAREYNVVAASMPVQLDNTSECIVVGSWAANVTRLGGDDQSLADLKDFADAGYDPATNKVQGVVLVDTTTTNTDMRGTDNAATAADLATVAGYLDTEIAAILADTNELQTNQNNWLTATGFSTHSAADVWASATRVLTAGTNIVLAKGTGVTGFNDITAAAVVTAMGTGTFLTAIPWNADWGVQVESEVADALAVYDPPTNAEMEARTIAAASYATAAAQTTAQTSIDAIPTNAELATALDALPTAAENAAAILAAGDVDGFTLEETLKLCLAALAGKLSGAATNTIVIRAADDSKARITATVDVDGNRSAVTLDEVG